MLDFYNTYKEKNTSIYFISISKINWYNFILILITKSLFKLNANCNSKV